MELVEKQEVIEAIEECDWYHIHNGRLVHGANSKTDEPLYKCDDIFECLNKLSGNPKIPEIIRCKDCAYWNKGYCNCEDIVVDSMEYYVGDLKTEQDDFCSHAKRKRNG